MLRIIFSAVAVCLLNSLVLADNALTVDRIFREKEFSSKPYSLSWEKDGNNYLRTEDSEIVRYNTASGDRSVVIAASDLIPSGESEPLAISSYSFSEDNSKLLVFTNTRKVWRLHTRGDYWVLDRATGELRKLGGDAEPATLMFAKFSPDGNSVAFVRDNRLYVEDLLGTKVKQLTSDPDPNAIYGTSDWVNEEEFWLRDGFRWSPDGKRIAFWMFDTSEVRKFSLVNQTDSLYPRRTEFHYPKVGQRNSACRIGVLELAKQKLSWLKLPGDLRNNYVPKIHWQENSERLVVEFLNRLQNTNRLLQFNVVTGAIRREVVESDEAWVNVHDEVQWLDDDQRMTWISERSGWRRAELIDWRSSQRKEITPVDFDVIKLLHVDEKRKLVYFIASPENAAQRYLYSCTMEGGECKRISPPKQPGEHSYSIDPTGQFALHTLSAFGKPPVTEIVSLPEHKVVRTLDDNSELVKKIAELESIKHEFLNLKNRDGLKLDAWLMRPATLEKGRKYPLLVYVYGEPAGQTVRDRWGGSSYLWHRMLVEQGYVVVSIDNRGTPAPRGREWRRSVYRKIGIIAPQDQADGVRSLLKQKRYLDSSRVGVWGWSGGGSMTLNAMFKHPDLYHVGISIASVPNQRYYDTIYQERYMGLPGDNVEGFIQGSPIHFAKNLQGKLLLIHGTGDDNCHYQGCEALINELIRHDKQFDMMAYPNRSHSIREGENTSAHLRQLMTRYITTHL